MHVAPDDGIVVCTLEKGGWRVVMRDQLARGVAASGDGGRGTGGRRDFVGFKERLVRLVESLVALRPLAGTEPAWTHEPERAEVKLEADEVVVTLTVARPPWDTECELVRTFQRTFSGSAPMLVDSPFTGALLFAKARETEGGYGWCRRGERTTLEVCRSPLGDSRTVRIRTSFARLDDHFETFVTEAARVLFPPVEAPKRQAAMDLESWHREYARAFEELGCRALRESSLGWSDLVGLENVRERLERAVLLPLVREELYRKVANAVMPASGSLLPRGVLLTGPPGTGKTWSMRALAGEAGLPVVVLSCDGVLTKWYGESERRLAAVFRLCRNAGRMVLYLDELDALTRRRQDSHETTARLVSILLSEMDGLGARPDVVIVGSANATDAIDPAVLDRFDLSIAFELPDEEQRRLALAYYARHLPAEDVAELAGRMEGWSFRRLARFAESVVREYVSELDLSQLEAAQPPLPALEDYRRILDGAPP